MKQLVILLSLFLFNQTLFAQHQGLLVGKITDQNSLPLPGVSIQLLKTHFNSLSDERGNYQVKVPAGNYRLIFSHLGFKDMELEVPVMNGRKGEVNVLLIPDSRQMEEVVIAGVRSQTTTIGPTRIKALDIPQSITVIGQRIIQQQAAFDLSTLSRNVPGITFTGNYSGAGSSQFFNARGFELNETQNYRWNGMMVLNWGNQYADNIEQVEFLKGPASILYGDIAPGGVMNFVTKKPLGDFSANLNFKTGSWGLIRPSIDVTGPILKDRSLRYRLNATLENRGSFRDQVNSSVAFAAPSIAWDISKKLSLNFEAVFKDSKATDDAGLVSPDGTSQGLAALRPSLYLGEAARKYLYNDQSYFATLTYEISPLWRIKATAFNGISTNRPFGIWFDQPDAQGNFTRRGYGFYRRAVNHTLSGEASGTFFTGGVKHQVSIGLEYQMSRSRQTNGGALNSLDVANLHAPEAPQAATPAPVTSPFLPYAMMIQRKGIYLHDQLSFFSNRLSIHGGIRVSHTSQGNRYLQNEVGGTPYAGLPDDVVKKFMLIPRLGIVYKPNLNYSLYGSYSKGVEINSPDIFAKNYLEFASPPATTSTQVELGFKTSLLNNRLGITLAVFKIDKRKPYGYVYLDPVNPNYDEYNVYYEGQHRSQGIELEMDGRILDFLSVNGGLAITSTKVMYDPGYPTGNLLPNAPKFSFNYWINYEHPRYLKGFTAGTGIFYKGKFYPGIDNNPKLLMQPAYTWDASLGYHKKQLGLQLNIMNLTNRVSYLNPWQFNLFDVQPLRQAVVTLNYKFNK